MQDRWPLKWEIRILLECILVFARYSRVLVVTELVVSGPSVVFEVFHIIITVRNEVVAR